MQIGICGLALSHPYTFAEVLARRGTPPAYVWDADPERALAFAERYGARHCSSPEEMARCNPAGVMICGVAASHVAHSRPFFVRSIPLFIDRPLAVSRGDLHTIRTVAQERYPLLSTSILRYGAAFAPVREALAANRTGQVLAAHVTICHDIGAYLKPGNTWQDDRRLGGGTLMTMGLHALELLAVTLGTGWTSVQAAAGRVRYRESRSEDVAALTLTYGDGRIATVQIIGAATGHRYSLTVHGSDGSVTASAPTDPAGEPLDQYGYTGTVDAFVELIRTGCPPVPLAETYAIAETLLLARSLT